jgi:replication factor C subunit 3/5
MAANVSSERPWSDKYRPQTLDEVASHADIIQTSALPAAGARRPARSPRPPPRSPPPPAPPRARAVKKLISEDQLPHLLLYGPPGTGKTSTVLALAKQMYGAAAGNMTLELNASDDRGIGIVRNEVQDFASTRPVFSNKAKLVILDECDAMTKDAQMALRRVMERYVRNARFVLICNYVSKIIPALQSRCTRFRFQPLPQPFVCARLEHICAAEGVAVREGGLDALIDLGGGDMRRTLNLLQSTSMSAGEVSEASAYATAGKPRPAEIEDVARWLLNDPLPLAFESATFFVVGRLALFCRVLHRTSFSCRSAPPSAHAPSLASPRRRDRGAAG